MRFGKFLADSVYPPWRDSYIDYGRIKKLLREPASAGTPAESSKKDPVGWTDEDETAFVQELVNVQLNKVVIFLDRVSNDLKDDTKSVQEQLTAVESLVQAAADRAKQHASTQSPATAKGKEAKAEDGTDDDELAEMLEGARLTIHEIAEKLSRLATFCQINYTGFLKAAKKHDRRRGNVYKIRPLVFEHLSKLLNLLKLQGQHDRLLFQLSVMDAFARHGLVALGRDVSSNKSTGVDGSEDVVDPEGFTSYKFWIHPDNLLEVKTIIMRELPVLVYTSKPNPRLSAWEESVQNPTLTSIYFDNQEFELYMEKVSRKEGAASVRVNWHGPLSDNDQVVLEMKSSGKVDSRLPIKPKNVHPFISKSADIGKMVRKLHEHGTTRLSSSVEEGTEDSDGLTELRQQVERVEEFVTSKSLRPMLRANYSRTAYQIPGDQRVRVSIDSDLAFIREGAGLRTGEWHRCDLEGAEYPFKGLSEKEISRFPYAVLDIKVQKKYERSSLGGWVGELRSSHLVASVPGFSKFLHGIGILFEERVNRLPVWVGRLEEDIRKDAQEAFEERQTTDAAEATATEQAVGSFLEAAGAGSLSRMDAIEGVLSPAAAGRMAGSVQGKSRLVGSAAVSTAAVPGVEEEEESEGEDSEGYSSGSGVVSAGEGRRRGRAGGASWGDQIGRITSRLMEVIKRDRAGGDASTRDAPLPEGVRAPAVWIKDRNAARVEPKVWLANERTFVRWMSVSVLLGGLAVGMFNAADSGTGGTGTGGGGAGPPPAGPVPRVVVMAMASVYLAIAAGAGWWGWWVYMLRARLIEARSGEDLSRPAGPLVVAAGLMVGLGVNWWVRVAGGV